MPGVEMLPRSCALQNLRWRAKYSLPCRPELQYQRERIQALAAKQIKLVEDVEDLKNLYVGLASLILFLLASAGTALALIELLGHSA
jgi:hypothetical protein